MYLCAGRHPEALFHRVIDLDNGKEIPKVIWADDERGRLRRYRTDKKGRLVLNKKRDAIETILETGRRIKIERVNLRG